MKSKIAEDLRLAGNAKFYHSITYSSIEDIKADIVGLIKEHGDKYTAGEYLSLFEQADYWLEPRPVNRRTEEYAKLWGSIMSFDLKGFVVQEWGKLHEAE